MTDEYLKVEIQQEIGEGLCLTKKERNICTEK